MFRNILGFSCIAALGGMAYFGFELSRVDTVLQQISARVGLVGCAIAAVCCIGFTASIDPSRDP